MCLVVEVGVDLAELLLLGCLCPFIGVLELYWRVYRVSTGSQAGIHMAVDVVPQGFECCFQLGFIAASAILIGGATVTKARVGHVILGVFLFEGVLSLGQQVVNAAVAGGGLSEVMRIMISNGIILYALTQSGGVSRD